LNLYVFLVINWVFFVVVKTVNGTEREAKKEMGLLREKGNKVSREVMIIFAPWNMYGNGGLVII